MLTIDVVGTPAPQGSKRGFVTKNGRVAMTESSTKVKPWRQDVKAAAIEATDRELTGPLNVIVIFYLRRPQVHYGTGRNVGVLKSWVPMYVDKKPDLDKLLRSTLDGLKEAGVYRDDAQVARVVGIKRYATDRPPGARIRIEPIAQATDTTREGTHT